MKRKNYVVLTVLGTAFTRRFGGVSSHQGQGTHHPATIPTLAQALADAFALGSMAGFCLEIPFPLAASALSRIRLCALATSASSRASSSLSPSSASVSVNTGAGSFVAGAASYP